MVRSCRGLVPALGVPGVVLFGSTGTDECCFVGLPVGLDHMPTMLCLSLSGTRNALRWFGLAGQLQQSGWFGDCLTSFVSVGIFLSGQFYGAA
jgi:hypothetical protein